MSTNTLPKEFRGVQIEETQPTVSTRRRLQNRIAQRKLRERRALKTLSVEDSAANWMFTINADTDDGRPYSATNRQYIQDPQNFLDDRIENIKFAASRTNQPPHLHSPDTAGGAIGHVEAVIDTQQHAGRCYPSPQSPSSLSGQTSSGVNQPVVCSSDFPSSSSTSVGMNGSNIPLHGNLLDDCGLLLANHTGAGLPSSESGTPPKHYEHGDPQLTNNLGGSVAPKSNASSQLISQVGTTKLPPLLHTAARSRNCRIVETLLRRGVAAVNERDEDGRTALHIAAELGDETTMSLLLSHGAHPCLRDLRGQNALYIAVSEGHQNVVELLLGSGE
ncbi:MAG: hypothetical protein Q9165_008591 [Trypethelium subeluteriae]